MVPTSRIQEVPLLITLMSPRRWSPGARRVMTIGPRTVWTPGMRLSDAARALRTQLCRQHTLLHRLLQRETLGASLRLPSLALSAQSLCLGPRPPCPLPVREA